MRTGSFSVRFGDTSHRVTISALGEARVDDGGPLLLSSDGEHAVIVREGDRTRRVVVAAAGDGRQVFVDGEIYDLTVGTEAAGRRTGGRAEFDQLAAPMPARVTAVHVGAGQRVQKGDVLITLEAMKMELAVRAPREGAVKRVACHVGDLVQPGVGLLELV